MTLTLDLKENNFRSLDYLFAEILLLPANRNKPKESTP